MSLPSQHGSRASSGKISVEDLAHIVASWELDGLKSSAILLEKKEIFRPDFLDIVIIKALEKGDWEKVDFLSDFLILNYPFSWQGYARKAQLHLKRGRYFECRILMEIAMAKIGSHLRLLAVLSDLERSVGHRDASLEIARKMQSDSPCSPIGYVREIEDLVSLGDLSAALEFESSLPANILSEKIIIEKLGWLKSVVSGKEQFPSLFRAWSNILNSPARLEIDTEVSMAGCASAIREGFWHPFQYWSQGVLPVELEQITHAWNGLFSSLGVAPIEVWNKKNALEWISEYEPDFLEVFLEAPHFAVEADIFRLLLARKRNSVWIDIDYYPKPLAGVIMERILSQELSCLIMLPPEGKPPFVNNAFFCSVAGCSFFEACVEGRRGFSFKGKNVDRSLVHASFGPRYYNKILENICCARDGGDLYLDQSCSPFVHKITSKCVKIQLIENGTFAYNKRPGLDMNSVEGYSNWQTNVRNSRCTK